MGSAKSRGLVLFTVLAVLASDAVRAWDLGVVTRTQIQLLKQKVVENTAAEQLKEMVAAAYDPVRKIIYVSDSNTKSGSIFRIRTVGDLAFVGVEPIVTEQFDAVQGIAFDDRTYTLYWTTGIGHTINYLRVPENGTKGPLPGHVLLTFKREIPQGIAIDSCRGYLYWTNIYHLNATIERSRLDGTDRQVIVHENLFQPLGIAVDMEQDLLYWTNEREGLYYSIEISDLNGGSRKTLIQGTHHQPFSIALDDQNLYWSDWTNNAVYMLPKSSFQYGGRPEVYEKVYSPMGLISKSGNMTFINETYCAINRSEDIVMPTEPTPTLIPYDVLRNLCKNNGVPHANGTCTCAIGFIGEYCQTAVLPDKLVYRRRVFRKSRLPVSGLV